MSKATTGCPEPKYCDLFDDPASPPRKLHSERHGEKCSLRCPNRNSLSSTHGPSLTPQKKFPESTRLTNEHFIHDHPQRPPVTELVVPGLHEHLRSNVVRSAYCGEGLKHAPQVREAWQEGGSPRSSRS